MGDTILPQQITYNATPYGVVTDINYLSSNYTSFKSESKTHLFIISDGGGFSRIYEYEGKHLGLVTDFFYEDQSDEDKETVLDYLLGIKKNDSIKKFFNIEDDIGEFKRVKIADYNQRTCVIHTIIK